MTAARPNRTSSNGVPVLGLGRGRGETKVSRIEFELSVARPLATLQLWTGIITSRLRVDRRALHRPQRNVLEQALDFGTGGSGEARPLELGVPYPWTLYSLNQEQAQLIFEVEQSR